MFEKVNPSHPDKIADRIAGAIVDLAYKKEKNPKIAVEVLIGHNLCTIIVESSININKNEIKPIVNRICGKIKLKYICVKQDVYLNNNQKQSLKCGDNGIFKGVPITKEQNELSKISKNIYNKYHYDGKYVYDKNKNNLIICQSNAKTNDLKEMFKGATINPLGDWFGGINVDTGATNRKLGSDMGNAVTGGGLHGKDLSKADVTLNIYAHLKAQEINKVVNLYCAIGDEFVDNKKYSEIVEIVRDYINKIGGFEKFAEWGLI